MIQFHSLYYNILHNIEMKKKHAHRAAETLRDAQLNLRQLYSVDKVVKRIRLLKKKHARRIFNQRCYIPSQVGNDRLDTVKAV